MADETDPRLQLLLQETGGNTNTWGENLNDNFEKLSEAVAGTNTIVVTGSTLNLTDDQQRYAVLKFSGTLTANQIIVVNDEEQWWIVDNATSGEYDLEFKSESGNGGGNVIVAQGSKSLIYCDGTDVVDTGIATSFDTEYGDGNIIYNIDGTGPFYSMVSAPDSQTAQWAIGTDGVLRWSIGKDAVTEGGSDAGSDLALIAYDDSGTAIATYVTITRATGAMDINGALTVNSLTVEGTTAFGNDANFSAFISTNPILAFDSTDTLTYDRTNDAFLFAIASTEVADINASGLELGGTGPRVSAFATSAEFLANTADKALVTDEVWDSADEVTVTFATSLTLDFSSAINFYISATDNLTLQFPSNVKAGQSGCIRVFNSGGARSTSFADGSGGEVWFSAEGEAPETGTVSGAADLIFYHCLTDTQVAIAAIGGAS